MGRDGGGAEVDGQPVETALMIARPEVEEARTGVVVALMQRDRDLPLALAQGGLQAAQDGEVGFDILHLPLVAQRQRQPLEIARGFVHVGLGDLDVEKARRRVHDDVAHGCRFPDHLLVHLAFGRHVDHHVAHDLRLAAEATPVEQAADRLVALLDRVPLGQRVGMRR